MKRTILILILFLASTAAALAAGGLEISGKVVDAASGEPVPGAIVRLDENYLWAITDEDGEFESLEDEDNINGYLILGSRTINLISRILLSDYSKR